MQHRVLKYILDIESVIAEIESFKESVHNDYSIYKEQIVVKRAIERDLEIIGEAVRKMCESSPDLTISGSRKIIGLRNLIAHAYDTVEDELIWGIIQKDIPILKKEIEDLRKSL
jgi:uncharacterized protein with HEPN domain